MSRFAPVSPDVLARAARIRLLISDVDGVLTDGHIYMGNEGEQFKAFHIQDGFGIKALQNAGIAFAVITGRQSEIVRRRMEELGVGHVIQGRTDKIAAMESLRNSLGLRDEQIAHIGDDLPDLPLFARIGLGVSVADAYVELRKAAHYVTEKTGGRGAVREVCDLILHAQGLLDALVAGYRHG